MGMRECLVLESRRMCMRECLGLKEVATKVPKGRNGPGGRTPRPPVLPESCTEFRHKGLRGCLGLKEIGEKRLPRSTAAGRPRAGLASDVNCPTPPCALLVGEVLGRVVTQVLQS